MTINILSHDRKAALATSLKTMRSELAYPRDRLEFVVLQLGNVLTERVQLGLERLQLSRRDDRTGVRRVPFDGDDRRR